MTAVVSRPDVRYGDGAIRSAPQVVAESGARRVLLVCGRRSFEASGAAEVLPALATVAEVRRWSGFAANPDAADLAEGLAIMDDFRPDLVLGVGGGSALDTAKLLCAFPPPARRSRANPCGSEIQPRGSALDRREGAALRAAIRTGRPAAAREPRLVLAPTTSGSGSEATHFAVVYIGEKKFSVAGASLRPDVVLLDPALSRSGSPYQRATSGIDAVAQAVESLWAVAATVHSRRYASHALRLLLPAIEQFVADPTDETARAMSIGSHLAGRAIDVSRTTAAHALSYAITKRYGVSHGHAVALTLGAFIEAHDEAAARPSDPGGPAGWRLREEVDPAAHAAVMAELRHRFGAADGPSARAGFGALLRRLGLDPSLSAAGAGTAADRAALAAAVNTERLGNNPVAFTQEQLAQLLIDLP